jgi:hypothetical protein
MKTLLTLGALAASASAISSTLNINNWYVLGSPCHFFQVNSLTAFSQVRLRRLRLPIRQRRLQPGAAPYTIKAGNGATSVSDFQYNVNPSGGSSIKIAKDQSFGKILQFEYTVATDAFYWDLSDLDGAAASVTGSPFADQNVKVSPTGNGSGQNSCTQLKCPANQVCAGAYQKWDDNDTRSCPLETGIMWLDLCEPAAKFAQKREELLSADYEPEPGHRHRRSHARAFQA